MIGDVYQRVQWWLLGASIVISSLLFDRTQASGNGIGCFTCHSFNGSDPGCHDPFHPSYSHYEKECMQGMQGRVGLFVAHYCIKMSGINVDSGYELVVRTCALESMAHQCGMFNFEDNLYKGCLTTCEKDGCNAGTHVSCCLSGIISSISMCFLMWPCFMKCFHGSFGL